MLDKLGGAFAPKPSPGPHKERECLPLVVMLRNRLKYALTYREVVAIVMQRLISIDGKVRTDKCYPAGFMDVISIAKTNENFRLVYDNKGRFTLHHISAEEAKYSCARLGLPNSETRVFHISPLSMAAPSGTQILSSRPTTL